MGKKLEIQSDIVWGTKSGGKGKDYNTSLRFNSAPGCSMIDPRNWIKEFPRINFKPVTVFALRVERAGITFMIWTQTDQIGERDGDGRYTYLFVPSDINISGCDISRILFETKRLSETTGKLCPEFEKKINESEWQYQMPVTIPTNNRDEARYGYVHYDTEQDLIEILDHRHQKAFGMYRWVALSDKDAKYFIKSGISVDDITSKVKQKYVLWEPSKYTRGEWSPVLNNPKGTIPPKTYIYSDEALSISWTYKDNRYRYDGYTKISSFDDFSLNATMDRYFETSRILSRHLIEISGEHVSATDLVYHGNTRNISVEIVDKKYCVYLSEAETLKLEKLELKNKGYTLQIEGNGVVISKRNPVKLIYFEDDYLCRIDENGHVSPSSGANKPIIIDVPNKLNEKKYTFRRNEIAYFLKHKWWFLLVVFIIGLLAGFFINNMLSGHTRESSVYDSLVSINIQITDDEIANDDTIASAQVKNQVDGEKQSTDRNSSERAKNKTNDIQQHKLIFSFNQKGCSVKVNNTDLSSGNDTITVNENTNVTIKVSFNQGKKVKQFKLDNENLQCINSSVDENNVITEVYTINEIRKDMIINIDVGSDNG